MFKTNYLILVLIGIITTGITFAKEPIMIKNSEEAVIWAGLDFPEKFEFENLEKDSKEEILQKGLINLAEAAKNGSGRCVIALADYYINSLNDFKNGVYWCLMGAEHGSMEAMTILRFAYLNGDGVVKDNCEGYKWSFLAAALGSQKDKTLIEELYKNDPKDPNFVEGHKKALIWEKEHPFIFPRRTE